jgi:hypothetical protein
VVAIFWAGHLDSIWIWICQYKLNSWRQTLKRKCVYNIAILISINE